MFSEIRLAALVKASVAFAQYLIHIFEYLMERPTSILTIVTNISLFSLHK